MDQENVAETNAVAQLSNPKKAGLVILGLTIVGGIAFGITKLVKVIKTKHATQVIK